MRAPTTLLVATVVLLLLLAATGCAQPTPSPTPTAEAATSSPPPTAVPSIEPDRAAPLADGPTAAPTRTSAPTASPSAAADAESPRATIPPPPTFPPFFPAPAWQPDGIVSPDEYTHSTSIGQVSLSWKHDGDSLFLAMSGPTTGWIAIGIAPENRMQGANFLLGYVAGGEASVFDAYGTGPVGATHPKDTDLGGTDDILASGGSEAAGTTVIEVQIPLASDDAFDKPLVPGNTYPVIVALGDADAFDARHSFRASGELSLSP